MDFMTEPMITYKRQVLQRMRDPPLPPGNALKDDDVQKWLAKNIFNESIANDLGAAYLRKQLDRVILAIEKAITNPEDEVCHHHVP